MPWAPGDFSSIETSPAPDGGVSDPHSVIFPEVKLSSLLFMTDNDEAMKGQSFHQPSQPEVTSQNLSFLSEQQVEEKRLCSDIHRYLVNKSSGVFHYSVELRTIIVDIIGISYKSSEEEIREAETRLLDLLYSDPQRRFSIIGEYDQIFVKLAPLDEDQINKLVEEWRCLIASFLFESKRIVCLSDIGSR